MPQLDIHHIIFEGQGRAEIFSFRPENVEKEKRGNLFLLGRVAKNFSRQDASYYVLNSIAAVLKKEYYSPAHSQSVQSFEIALKKANALLTTLDPEILQTLEMVAFAIAGGQVTFSIIGHTEVLLLRNERLFRLAKPHAKEKRLFLHVTKGSIKAKDKVIIASSQITEWLGNSSFTSRLIKRPLERVREYLQQERREKKDNKSFALLSVTIHGQEQSLKQEEGALQELSSPALPPIQPPAPLPRRFTPLPTGASNALNSLKRFYLHNWHGKQSVSQLTAFFQKNIVTVKNRFPALVDNIYSPKALGIGAVAIIIVIWTLSSLIGPTSTTLNKNSQTALLANQEGLLLTFPGSMEVTQGLKIKQAVYTISQGKLFSVDLESKKADSLLSLEGEFKGLTSSLDTIFLIEQLQGKQWQVISINPSARSVKKEPLTWPLETDLVKDVRYYERNLYLAEKFSGQIVKYPISQLTKPSLWISSKGLEQIKNPLSFAVDGSLYLLQEGKESITQLRAGQVERVIPLPPGIRPHYIVASPDLSAIYLFNTLKGELAVIDKRTFTLVKTLSHQNLVGLHYAGVNETEELVEIINNKGVFQLSISQKNEAL